jgi:hypothetical protein
MRLNLTPNQKFNKLTALHFVRTRNHRTIWKFICDCGNVVETLASAVKCGEIKSCGCLQKFAVSEHTRIHGGHNKQPKGQAAFNNLYSLYKRTAKKNNKEFELTPEQFRSLTSSKCYFCGKVPYNEHRPPSFNGGYLFNGIDRINNNVGYILENCVPCCTLCNYTKRNLTLIEFKELIKNIYNNLFVLKGSQSE